MRLALRGTRWTVERQVAADPADVWSVLTDLDAWPRWGPTVSRAELDGSGPLSEAARGTVWTAVGVPLPFVIDELLPQRRWSWRVGGVPATSHWVAPDPTGCRVGMDAPLWAPAYVPVLATALRRIEQLVSPADRGR